MVNKITSALSGAALLTFGAQAQAETVEQAQARLSQLIAEAPEAIVKVIQSGEGCDMSILNTALETDNYEPYEQCVTIDGAMTEIEIAKKAEALAEVEDERAKLQQENIVLSEKNKQLEQEILAGLLE